MEAGPLEGDGVAHEPAGLTASGRAPRVPRTAVSVLAPARPRVYAPLWPVPRGRAGAR